MPEPVRSGLRGEKGLSESGLAVRRAIDGIPDLLLPADGSIGIALGMGKGTFYAPFVVGAGPGVGKLFMQNLHGLPPTAGLPDLVAPDSTGGVRVLVNITK